MPDAVGAEPSAGDRSPLDQAAADGSITQARIRSVDPVPIVRNPSALRWNQCLKRMIRMWA